MILTGVLALLFGVHAASAGHFSAPLALAPEFKVFERNLDFAPLCAPDAVVGRVAKLLTAFNAGRSSVFAQSFRPSTTTFHPYSGARRIGSYYPGPSVCVADHRSPARPDRFTERTTRGQP